MATPEPKAGGSSRRFVLLVSAAAALFVLAVWLSLPLLRLVEKGTNVPAPSAGPFPARHEDSAHSDTLQGKTNAGAPALPSTRRPAALRNHPAPKKHVGSATVEVASVPGRLDSWEDWNSSFADTATRICSAIFDSACIDTLPGRKLGFAASGKPRDLIPVRNVFCAIDTVRKFMKYTFPGQSVDFSVGVGFNASVSFTGMIHPFDKKCALIQLSQKGEDPPAEGVVHNQVLFVLNSVPGYAYTLRAAIECYDTLSPLERVIYYTRPTVVEFRRFVRYQDLLSAAGDTVFIVSENPLAPAELARAIPRSAVVAVLVRSPGADVSSGDQRVQDPSNLSLFRRSPRQGVQSFLVLNAASALLEGKDLDPEFKRILQLRRRDARADKVEYPHVTTLIQDRLQVQRLMDVVKTYLQPGS